MELLGIVCGQLKTKPEDHYHIRLPQRQWHFNDESPFAVVDERVSILRQSGERRAQCVRVGG